MHAHVFVPTYTSYKQAYPADKRYVLGKVASNVASSSNNNMATLLSHLAISSFEMTWSTALTARVGQRRELSLREGLALIIR